MPKHMKRYEHIEVGWYSGIIHSDKKEETAVTQWDESQKHCVKQKMAYTKKYILRSSIYFKFKRSTQNKTSFTVLEARREFIFESGVLTGKI